MQLLFLGTGSAFTVGSDNYQSNMLLRTDSGEQLLIDCGSDIRWSLYDQGLSYRDITHVYISHLHADHVGGLEYLGFSSKYDPQCPRPTLILSKSLESDLWERTLSGGMRMLEGDLACLDSFFQVCPVGQSREFTWQGVRFELVQTVHVNSGFGLMPSYGLFFEVDHRRILITTDCQLRLDYLSEFYERADLIFQDCETAKRPTPVHAHYQQLRRLPATIRQKMWLYGYNPGPIPDAAQDGFCGFIQKGQCFDFAHLQDCLQAL
ncbi:MBL fold metallo-hydrolase [Lyngbya confervoides]|uniref:MBL fold metallo-hydrolase n=1 Tax=Lyngbya confervoides BDU141951 TaxID=1574623 RepID=A0ABD4T7J3_9CYAN|nr:MBL fold metallo-hydrolase [Lyngbya confervoides]MCM1984586.1 MBL fold metallo-hydrolase [Lyngbya confervoides BDU141951]